MRVEDKSGRTSGGKAAEAAVEKERAYRAALSLLPRMSPLGLPRMIRMAGSAKDLWEVFREGGRRSAALAGWERAVEWEKACRKMDPDVVLEGLVRRGIQVILPHEEAVPEILWNIYDPPALLFLRGNGIPRSAGCVAVVGARKATSYGKSCAEHLAEGLARHGVVVVSGAAYGIDAHAHRGCLREGGFTVAVLGCGIDRAYPPEHAALLARIAETGCVLSEYPPGAEPQPWRFPHRNRIIAGLSLAVVVVEATARSGALITAEFALEEGREVMAVPGLINQPLAEGTHALIQKGAKLVAGVEDILEELPPEAVSRTGFAGVLQSGESLPDPAEPSPLEQKIVELLTQGPGTVDLLSLHTGKEPPEIISILTTLVVKGWVRQDAGGRFALSSRSLGRLSR